MPAPTKPSLYMNWTNGMSPQVTQPPSSLQTSGWVPGELPPPDYMNWLFWLADAWIQWLDYEVENVVNVAGGVNANSTVLSTTGNITINSDQLTTLASTTGLLVGQLITGTGIPSSTYVLKISGSTVTMSKKATSTLTTNAVTFSHAYATGANVQVQLDALDAELSAITNLQYAVPVVANYNVSPQNSRQVLQVDTSVSGANGPVSLQMPDPATMKNVFFSLIDVGGAFNTNNVTLVRFGSEKILNVAANYVISANNFFGTFFCDGTNYWRVS